MPFMTSAAAHMLAKNLNQLKEQGKNGLTSQPKIAKKAHVGQRTVGRALAGEVATTIGTLDGLAHAFDMEAWQLLHPTMGVMPDGSHNDPLLFQLINFWGQLSPESRDKLVTDANWLHSKEHPGNSHSNPYAGAPRESVTAHDKEPASYHVKKPHHTK